MRVNIPALSQLIEVAGGGRLVWVPMFMGNRLFVSASAAPCHPPWLHSLPLPPTQLAHIFFPREFYQPHRRTMTVMTRPSAKPDRAWCITPSPVNNPLATIPILQLEKSRSWEPDKLSSNYERMPLWHRASQNHRLARPWVHFAGLPDKTAL